MRMRTETRFCVRTRSRCPQTSGAHSKAPEFWRIRLRDDRTSYHQMNESRVIFLPVMVLAVCLAAMVLPGCGPRGVERCVVTGTVTLNGKPIDSGEIHFVPINGTKGPVWAAYIKDGKYSAHGKGGVPVGQLRVEIDAWKEKRVNYGNDEFGDLGDGIERVSVVPAKYYGKASVLEMEIPPGSGEIVKNFELEK